MLILGLVLAALGVSLTAWSQLGWLAWNTRKDVVVHTKDDESFRGLLLTTRGDALVLMDARHLTDQGETQMAGHTVLPKSNVRAIQVVS